MPSNLFISTTVCRIVKIVAVMIYKLKFWEIVIFVRYNIFHIVRNKVVIVQPKSQLLKIRGVNGLTHAFNLKIITYTIFAKKKLYTLLFLDCCASTQAALDIPWVDAQQAGYSENTVAGKNTEPCVAEQNRSNSSS